MRRVLLLVLKRQMQGKSRASISNIMKNTLELLTRGNRLIGRQVTYVLGLFLCSFYSNLKCDSISSCLSGFYLSCFIWNFDLKFVRAQLAKAYTTANVLFEVLCAVNKSEKVEEVAPEVCPVNNSRYILSLLMHILSCLQCEDISLFENTFV